VFLFRKEVDEGVRAGEVVVPVSDFSSSSEVELESLL